MVGSRETFSFHFGARAVRFWEGIPPFPQGGPLSSYMYRPAYTTPIDGRKFVGLGSFHPKISGIYVVVSNLGLLFSSRNLREDDSYFDKQGIFFRWVGEKPSTSLDIAGSYSKS